MSKRPRRNRPPAFKAEVALASVRRADAGGTCPAVRRASEPDHDLEGQLLEGAAEVFGSEPKPDATTPLVDVKTFHAKIGELTLTNDFLSVALGKVDLLSAKQ